MTIIILLAIAINIFALKPDPVYHRKPNLYGLMYKELDIYAQDSARIKAWFYPKQEPLAYDSMKAYFDSRKIERPYVVDPSIKSKTIIICDGDANNMSYQLNYAYIFCTNGFNVLTFDWRGFGESGDFPVDTNYMAYNEFVLDYNAVIDAVKKIETVDNEKIGVFGFSTGAFFSFAIASGSEDVKAIIARGIFTDYQSTTANLKKLKPDDTYFTPKDIDNYSPRKLWGSFTKPIFLIVGENDNVTPKENSIEILANVKSDVRELWIVKGAAHGGQKAPEVIESDLFKKKAIRFFNENL